MKLELKNKAIELRREGSSYAEIRKALGPLSKSTLSRWLKNIELSKFQRNELYRKTKNRSELGRLKGGATNHEKRLVRISEINKRASAQFKILRNNPLFFVGIMLYLAEGSKTTENFQFINSDPKLVNLMIKWMVEIGEIPVSNIKARLYIHKIYAHEQCEEFWEKVTKLNKNQFYQTTYKETAHTVKKNLNYKGCLRIGGGASELYWKVIKWGELMHKSFGI